MQMQLQSMMIDAIEAFILSFCIGQLFCYGYHLQPLRFYKKNTKALLK